MHVIGKGVGNHVAVHVSSWLFIVQQSPGQSLQATFLSNTDLSKAKRQINTSEQLCCCSTS
jgi:hypothetical protein